MRPGYQMSVTLKRVTRKRNENEKTGAGAKCPDGRSAGREVSIRDSPLTMRGPHPSGAQDACSPMPEPSERSAQDRRRHYSIPGAQSDRDRGISRSAITAR